MLPPFFFSVTDLKLLSTVHVSSEKIRRGVFLRGSKLDETPRKTSRRMKRVTLVGWWVVGGEGGGVHSREICI